MAFLVLDLDMTVWTAEDEPDVHINHQLSDPLYVEADLFSGDSVRIINKQQLAQLIEYASAEHDGLIILTSGFWSSKCRIQLSAVLELSSAATEKLNRAYFHSSYTDQDYFNNHTPFSLMYMNKQKRLEAIIRNNKELQHKCFVVLDDSQAHFESFDGVQYVIPVLAATLEANQDFYQTAMNALRSAKNREMELNWTELAIKLVQTENNSGREECRFFSVKREPVSTPPLTLEENTSHSDFNEKKCFGGLGLFKAALVLACVALPLGLNVYYGRGMNK